VAHLPAGLYIYVVSGGGGGGVVSGDTDNGNTDNGDYGSNGGNTVNSGSVVLARGKVAIVR